MASSLSQPHLNVLTDLVGVPHSLLNSSSGFARLLSMINTMSNATENNTSTHSPYIHLSSSNDHSRDTLNGKFISVSGRSKTKNVIPLTRKWGKDSISEKYTGKDIHLSSSNDHSRDSMNDKFISVSGRSKTKNVIPLTRKWGKDSISEKYTGKDVRSYTQSANPNTTILLIVAYLRSGSTFTASLFSQHPDTFYVFEPLHTLKVSLNKKGLLRYINGTVSNTIALQKAPIGAFCNAILLLRFRPPAFTQDRAEESLRHWMHCGFANLDKDSLEDSFHYIYSVSMKSFVLCIKKRTRLAKIAINFSIRECIPAVAHRCNTAALRTFKVIRLDMSAAEHLLNAYPNVKILHLVRDPRGMFNSQAHTNHMLKNNDQTVVKQWCDKMSRDIDVTKRLLKTNRDRVYTIRYEDIAYDPLAEAKNLYTFADMTLTSKVKAYIKQSTSQNLKDGCAFCTRRGNSTKTANKWRTKISSPLLQIVNTHCADVYKKLGYFHINTTLLRNESIPSRTSVPLMEYVMQNNN